MADVATYAVLVIAGIVGTGPIIYLLATSLSKTYTQVVSPSALLHPTAINYEQVWGLYPVGRWLANSAIFAVTVTVLTLILDSASGFAFAKLRFRGNKLLFSMLLLAIMIPLPVTLLTTYLLVDDLGILNTYQGLILPVLAYPVGVFLMRQFFLTIPSELLDATRVDGWSEFRNLLPPDSAHQRAGARRSGAFRVHDPVEQPVVAALGVDERHDEDDPTRPRFDARAVQ